MADITHKGAPIHTAGELPAVGTKAPDFMLVGSDLSDVSLADYAGKTLVLNIFPSLDTGTCAMSVRTFNERAAKLNDQVRILNVSADLPFAQSRFCAAEGIDHVDSASSFRSDFSDAYGTRILDGKLAALNSRAVVVVSPDGTVLYREQVPEIAQEPDYDGALGAIGLAGLLTGWRAN